MKSISQRNFIKGLSSTESIWSQPKNTLPRLSNLLLNTRGALRTCDGSLIISELNGTLQPGTGPWTEISLFQPANVNRYYIGIKKDFTKNLGAPTTLAAADGGAGGSLANATYRYEVTALDGAGGETLVSNEVAFANPGAHKVNLTWTAVTNAIAYNVYRTAAGGVVGSETFIAKAATNAFTDDGSSPTTAIGPPTIDNTQQCPLYVIPLTSYADANIIKLLPADLIVPVDGTPGGIGSGGGVGPGGPAGSPPNPAGGVLGNISPIPQLIQFSNKEIAALGNGVTPQVVTDNSPAAPTSAAMTNSFVTAYPDWTAAVAFIAGDIIMPTVGNAGNFVFTCVQPGVTGAVHPTWPQLANQRVQETGQALIWMNTGATNSAPVPRGAAHAIVYAGSLWLYNTSPTTTADNFDGPTCLKMSDLNNPNSFNPINTAFIGKDDGDVGTGLAAFTIAAAGISPTGSMIAFKNFKSYQIVGVFGASDFSIQEAQTDMGNIAARSIQFLPGFGICRLSHLGFAILDQGITDRLISEQIRPYLFGGVPDIQALDWNFAYFSKGAQSANPPMYMCACPVAQSNLSTGTFSVGFGARAVGFIPGTYFYRFTKFTLINGVATEGPLSTEGNISPFGSPHFTLTLSNSVLDTTAVKFRFYVGTSSGSYTNFWEMTPAQFFAGTDTNTLGLAGQTGPGTINSGLGGLTRIFCYDLVLKGWTIIDLPYAISVLKQVRAVGTIPITIEGSFNDGSMRRLQAGDITFDGTPVAWSVRSAEVFGKEANERIYCRRFNLRGTTTQTTLSISATVNAEGGDRFTAPMTVYLQGSASGQSEFLAQVDLGYNAMNTHITLTGTGQAEIHAFDWEVVPMPSGVPAVIP